MRNVNTLLLGILIGLAICTLLVKGEWPPTAIASVESKNSRYMLVVSSPSASGGSGHDMPGSLYRINTVTGEVDEHTKRGFDSKKGHSRWLNRFAWVKLAERKEVDWEK
ncbi:hypothetical protein JYT83_01010 [bacterium AH-315-F18]|nr:hypothetical protein [bacterium AH-315-F18]